MSSWEDLDLVDPLTRRAEWDAYQAMLAQGDEESCGKVIDPHHYYGVLRCARPVGHDGGCMSLPCA